MRKIATVAETGLRFMHKTRGFSVLFSLPLFLASITLLAPFLLPAVSFSIQPPKTAHTLISGRNWAYTVPFPVRNKTTIGKLIQCESQGVNIARKDSNGKISWGILQFNGTSTWREAEARFNFYGSPLIPADAIHMADMMISAGELGKWSCAHWLHLL